MSNHGSSELTALKRAFENANGDVAQLESINGSLRRLNSEDANTLQADVAWALTRAKRANGGGSPAPAAPGPARAKADVLSRVLARAERTDPDGRPLFQYRVTEAEFSALRASLRWLHSQNRLESPGPRSAAVYVLYAAEWFRRHYEGHGLKWEVITPDFHLAYNSTVELTRKGLTWWRRKPRRINGAEERLLSLALEGGFPTRVLDAKSRGWLALYLRRLILELGATADPDAEFAHQLATRSADSLPVSFRNTEMFGLCAEFALAIDGLKRGVGSGQVTGQTVSTQLDVIRPTWRDDLPIRIEGEGARDLVDGLVDTSNDGLTGDGDARCQRLLMRDNGAWIAAIQMRTDGWLTGLADPMDDNTGRLRVRPAGPLADRLVGEIALIDPPVEKGPWRSRPRQRLIAPVPFPFREAVTVEVIGARGSRVVTWPKGEARRGEVLVFSDPCDEPSEHPPVRLELIGTGSVRSRKPLLYVLVPSIFNAVAEQHDCLEMWRGGGQTLYRLSSPTRLGIPQNWWRVSPGEQSDVAETLAVTASAPHGVMGTDPTIRLVTQPVTVRTRRGIHPSAPIPGEVFWRRPGAQTETDITRAGLPAGRVDVIWRDPHAGVIRDRVKLAVLPADARVRSKPQGDGVASFRLDGLEGWKAKLSAGSPAKVVPSPGGLTISFAGQPKRLVEFSLAPPFGSPIDVQARFPLADGGFARPDGTLFRQNQRVVIGDLKGARAFCEGARRLTLELRSMGSAQARDVMVSEDLPLWTLSDDIARLASASRNVDDFVRITIDPGGRRLDVGAYSVLVSTADRRITLEAETAVAGQGPFKLEWRSLYDPYPTGRKVLAEYTTLTEITGQAHPQPTEIQGPGLVFLRAGDFVIGRPSVMGGALPELQDLCGLQRAILTFDQASRDLQLDEGLAEIETEGPDATANLTFLHALVDSLDGIPPTAINLLARLPRHPGTAAIALVTGGGVTIREKVWRLERDLCFLWSLMPIAAWIEAFRRVQTRSRQTMAALGLTEEVMKKLVTLESRTLADELVTLDENLATPFEIAGVRPCEASIHRDQKEVAMDFIRRSADARSRRVAGCAFHDDPTIAPLVPAIASSFDPSFRQGLAAPYVAALRAAGKITLKRSQIIILRCSLADDPIYFSEAYDIGLRLFAIKSSQRDK